MQVSTFFKGHKGLVNSREDNFKTFNLFIPSKSQGRVAMERHFVASARFFGRNVDSKTHGRSESKIFLLVWPNGQSS